MEQTEKPSIRVGKGESEEDKLTYENESFVGNLPGAVPTSQRNSNGIGNIAAAQVFGTKWNHLVKTRRTSRQPSYFRSEDTIGLDDDVDAIVKTKRYNSDQAQLNKDLISHFINLAKTNDSDDEVNLDFIEELLEKGADINCSDKHGQGMLHEAARTWHTDIVLFLLQHGANVNMADSFERTPLHIAAAVDYPEMVELLVDNGGPGHELNSHVVLSSSRVITPSIPSEARWIRQFNMIWSAFQSAAPQSQAQDGAKPYVFMLKRKRPTPITPAFIEACTKGENQTPLHFAARNDASEALEVLIKLGAEVEAKDYKGRTPMFVAAELDRSETAKYLIDVNADATVVDNSGQICMTHMITKMGPVARTALDQFHKKDRANRRQYFYLNLLEVPRMPKGEKSSLAKTPLEVIVKYRQLDIIMHPVITRLIDIKWEQFGRRIALRTFLLNLVFVLIWTILGVAYPWQIRYSYTFPQDWWRVFFLVLGCLMTAYYVYDEINEIISSRKKFKVWKDWREKLIQEDMEFCHPKWIEEKTYLEREMETLDDMLPYYFQDFWNYFDWVVYFFILLVVLLHIIDVSITNRVPPCCSLTAPCDDFSITVCDNGFVNNANLSVWNNRIFVFTIIFLWLRLMKFTRAFRFFGPFIVMLGKLTWDIVRFLYLYLEFFIPYSCAFWMIFGNVQAINTMSTVDQMLFSLFRITLVDEYQFPEMQTYDVVMAYILVSSFLGVSAVLCINLFIALLSDTFQRVYDNANANAVMQQAALLLSFEENLRKRSKKRFRKYIENECSPESMYYDDDLTVGQDSDLKKVTIKIKEQMDQLLEHFHKTDRDKRLDERSDNMQLSVVEDRSRRRSRRPSVVESDDMKSPREGKIKPKTGGGLSDIVGMLSKPKNAGASKPSSDGDSSNESMQKMSSKMIELTSRIQRLQVSQNTQEDSYKRLYGEIKDIKAMLSLLVPGHGKTTIDVEKGNDIINLSKTSQKQFQSHHEKRSSVEEKDRNVSPSPSQKLKKKTSGLFKNILGRNVTTVLPTEQGIDLTTLTEPGTLPPSTAPVSMEVAMKTSSDPQNPNGANSSNA